MTPVSYDAFLPEVLPECAGIPEPLAINAVRNAAIDFCRRTLIWNEVQDAEVYTAGVGTYDLGGSASATPVFVFSVNLDENRVIRPRPVDEVVSARPAWATRTGNVEFFMQMDPTTFSMISVPETSGTYRAHVAYAPTRNSGTCNNLLFNAYLETIKAGALYRLKSMPGQPWSDPASAKEYRTLFNVGCSGAIADRLRGISGAILQVEPRGFV